MTPTKSTEENYRAVQEIIKRLTTVEELINEVNYFNNPVLESEVKNSLSTLYLIEAELKELHFKQKNAPFLKDEMFQTLANKSKDNLAQSKK